MRYTEKWVWQNQEKVKTSHSYFLARTGVCVTETVRIRTIEWMQAYRDRIRAIDTDEKAQAAIYDYYRFVGQELQQGLIRI